MSQPENRSPRDVAPFSAVLLTQSTRTDGAWRCEQCPSVTVASCRPGSSRARSESCGGTGRHSHATAHGVTTSEGRQVGPGAPRGIRVDRVVRPDRRRVRSGVRRPQGPPGSRHEPAAAAARWRIASRRRGGPPPGAPSVRAAAEAVGESDLQPSPLRVVRPPVVRLLNVHPWRYLAGQV